LVHSESLGPGCFRGTSAERRAAGRGGQHCNCCTSSTRHCSDRRSRGTAALFAQAGQDAVGGRRSHLACGRQPGVRPEESVKATGGGESHRLPSLPVCHCAVLPRPARVLRRSTRAL